MALFRLEKDSFELEVRQKYGNIRLDAIGPEVDVGGSEDTKKKSRNRKKKKKRN